MAEMESEKWKRLWEQLYVWVGTRHDYFEARYKDTNLSADAADMGAYRAVISAMRDMIEQENQRARQKMSTKQPAQSRPTARAGGQ